MIIKTKQGNLPCSVNTVSLKTNKKKITVHIDAHIPKCNKDFQENTQQKKLTKLNTEKHLPI